MSIYYAAVRLTFQLSPAVENVRIILGFLCFFVFK